MQIFGIYFNVQLFFVFGKKVSANENQNAAPIITYYRLNGNDITIQWKAPDGVSYSKVDIYSATSPNGSYRYENTVSGNSYTNTYVAKGVPYYYKLEASYEDNEGYKTVTTYAGKCIINPLPAPSSLEASTGNSHSITVKWKASDDCDGYQIYRSVSPDRNYELVQTVSNESRSSWWYDDDDESFQTYTQKILNQGKYIITRSVHTLHILMKHFMGIFLIIFLVRLRSMVRK